jgi:hypothetical protein
MTEAHEGGEHRYEIDIGFRVPFDDLADRFDVGAPDELPRLFGATRFDLVRLDLGRQADLTRLHIVVHGESEAAPSEVRALGVEISRIFWPDGHREILEPLSAFPTRKVYCSTCRGFHGPPACS